MLCLTQSSFAMQGSKTHADMSVQAEAHAEAAAAAERSANELLAEEERAKAKAAAIKGRKQKPKQKGIKPQLTSSTASIEAADPGCKADTESSDSASFLTQLFRCPLTQVSATHMLFAKPNAHVHYVAC